MILLYINIYNIKVNYKKYIYNRINNINNILNNIKKNKNIFNNYNKILKYINNIRNNFYIQYEEKEILKYIVYLKYKNKIKFKFFKNNNFKFFIFLYKVIKNKKKIILKIIKKYTISWTINRINPLNLIILLMAISEFYIIRKKNKKYIKILIYEYINISNIYTSFKSKFFINGILDKIFKTVKKI
ncbi:MAG: hypothetical protein NHF88_00475 [Candidatus Shikimatogenerans bostrichidophilus]|nr:MAG: hypothetical protein NHF88_00475 [Candidatus Shikimatogenerans bostrichidophilus]